MRLSPDKSTMTVALLSGYIVLVHNLHLPTLKVTAFNCTKLQLVLQGIVCYSTELNQTCCGWLPSSYIHWSRFSSQQDLAYFEWSVWARRTHRIRSASEGMRRMLSANMLTYTHIFSPLHAHYLESSILKLLRTLVGQAFLLVACESFVRMM